jgi:hypothetical protein
MKVSLGVGPGERDAEGQRGDSEGGGDGGGDMSAAFIDPAFTGTQDLCAKRPPRRSLTRISNRAPAFRYLADVDVWNSAGNSGNADGYVR